MITLDRPPAAPTTAPKTSTPRGKKPDRATQYALDVVEGRILTGKYVRLAAQRHLDLLEAVRSGARPDLRWNRSEAEAVIAFFGQLPQYQGRWADKPLELLDWEAFAVGCVFGWQIYDVDLKRWVRLYREAYVRVARKNGKALALDTPIPTPDGWTTMGELYPGDRVFDEQGQPCNVTAITPVMTERPCYAVTFSDGETLVADAEHEWLTRAQVDHVGQGGRGRKLHSRTRIRTTAEIAATVHYGARGDRNHSIPVAEPIQCEPSALPVPPYLLGAWLGDGHSAAALITTVDAEILEAIAAEGTVTQSYPGRISYRLGGGDRQAPRGSSVQAKLRALGVLGNKHIPTAYQRASIVQRMLLLRGLMDTDGYVSKAGQCEYTTTSERLAGDVLELVRGLGFKASLMTHRAQLDGRYIGPKYRIQFWAFQDRPVFALRRKSERLKTAPAHPTRSASRQIVSCEPVPSVPVRCIEVDSPSHLYLAGRSMVPTHNSTLCGGVGLWGLDFDGEPGAQVYAVATKRDQAKQVWTVAQQMVERKPQLASRIAHLRAVSRLIVYETMSVFAALGRDSDTEHGLNPSLVLLDELHIHPDRGMLDAMDTAMGAREQPLIWYITTAGVAGASIYNETDERMRKALDGRAPNERAFVLIYCLDEDDDWRDSRLYLKANPSLGHTVQLAELEAERDKAISTPGRRNSFIRLRLDTDTQSETAWLDINQWDACQVDALERTGSRHLGVDLGGRQDLSAAVKVTRSTDGGLDIDARFWMPEAVVDEAEDRDGVPYRAWIEDGWITLTSGDYRDDQAIADDVKTFAADVDEIDLDTWNSTTLLGLLADLGPELVLIPQTFPSLSPGVTEVERAVTTKQLAHRGNPVLRWMITNTALEENRDGGRKPVKVDRLKRRRHIDGVSAMLDAVVRLLVAKPADDEWGYGSV